MLFIDYYHWLEALHIISVISWMAGMLYLPRLYVYHAELEYNSQSCQLLQKMERRLLRIILNPAMCLTVAFGITLAIQGEHYRSGWFHWKASLVSIMLVIHMMLARYRKSFSNGKNTHSAFFYRIINETITVLMSAIVIIAVLKPL